MIQLRNRPLITDHVRNRPRS